MVTLLFSLQWVLAVSVSGLVLFKAWQITRSPSSGPLNHEALVTQGQHLMSGLYALRVLPSVAMTLGMLVAMLDLAEALQGVGMTKAGMSANDQKYALQHAFFAVGLAMATAGVGLGAGSWCRAKTQRRLEQLRKRAHATTEITAGSG